MIYTCIKYPIPGLVYIFCLQRFSCIFESTVLVLLLFSGRRLHSNVLSVHCEQELVGFASLLIGYGVWGDLIHHCETRRGLKKIRYLCEFYK